MDPARARGFRPGSGARAIVGPGCREGVLLQAPPGSVEGTLAAVGTQITGLSTLIQVQGLSL